jgi:hypothetical protein
MKRQILLSGLSQSSIPNCEETARADVTIVRKRVRGGMRKTIGNTVIVVQSGTI